jgi:hypothetical protein
MRVFFTAFIASLTASLFGLSDPRVAAKADEGMKSEIRIMEVARTPEPNTVQLRIAVPKQNEVVSGNPVWVQFRIEGFALGADSSQFQRADQIAVSDMGQTVHVVVDNEPYFAVNEPAINPFNETGYFYVQSYKFEMPVPLKDGMHTIRMFPARSFGESLKGENAFAVLRFYVGDTSSNWKTDFSKPFLTYNEPSDQMPLTEGQPILLDFLIENCELSPDGYKVMLTIDGTVNRKLTSWQPYYIYGLSKGKHTIRLELMNRDEKVPGIFNDVTRTIHVN